jgi:hypothetical protein
MRSGWCLVASEVRKFKEALKDGTLDPEKLSNMTSKDRRDFFGKIVSPVNAAEVNSLFESKLLLKNQQAGMVSWAKKVAGLSKPVRRGLIDKIERMDKVLDPKEADKFMEDLASTKLGMTVNQEQATAIMDMSRAVTEAKTGITSDNIFKDVKERLKYGQAVVKLGNYLADLKLEAQHKPIKERFSSPKEIGKLALDIAGIAKAGKAALDVSMILRQGWQTTFSFNKIWRKNSLESIKNFGRSVGGQEVEDAVNADILSRPNAISNRYRKAKLAIGVIEESYPTSIWEKIPGLGKLFKASEASFTTFQYLQRADIFDKILPIAEKDFGINIDDPIDLIPIGQFVNSITARGNLGVLEPAANVVNVSMFSPRFLASNIEMLTATPNFVMREAAGMVGVDKGTAGERFARKQHAGAALKTMLGSAFLLGIAKLLMPDSVDTSDGWEVSADFGKVKIGDTRFDLTGGAGGVPVLLLRLIEQRSKSSTSGNISEINSNEFGAMTGMDLVEGFFENKLSPAASILKDIINQRDFNGNPITVEGELYNMFVPLPITNAVEAANNPKAAPLILTIISDALGISANTYSQKVGQDWTTSSSQLLAGFKKKVGNSKFMEANNKFNQEYATWLNRMSNDPTYKTLDAGEKSSLQSSKKSELQAKIIKDYGYTAPKVDTTQQKKQSAINKALKAK